MVAYLICRKDVESLETVVFSAGADEQEEAIAVFTDTKHAEKYIEDAGWREEYTVATVEPIPFLRWLLQSYDNGIQYLVVDPNHADQESGQRINTLDIEAHLEHAGQHIIKVALPDF